MKDNIAITVTTANGKFRKLYKIVTEFGGYDEIVEQVNKIVEREFYTSSITKTTWSYS